MRVLQYAGDHIVSFSDHYFYQGLGETPGSGCAVLAHDAPGMTGRQYLQVDYRVDAGSGQTEIQRTATTY